MQLLPPGKDEDDIINEKKLQKLERKKFSKDQEVLMDELLPKATGREALLEKKALRREQARAREDSPEVFRERDVMGGGDDFQQRCVANSVNPLKVFAQDIHCRNGLIAVVWFAYFLVTV